MKKLLIFLVAAFVIFSMSVFAGDNGEKAFGDVFYKVLPTGQTPVYPPNATDWTLVPANGNVNFQVAVGQDLFVAIQNAYVATNATDLTLEIAGAALLQLSLNDVWADPAAVISPRGNPFLANNLLRYPYRFIPQPDWHYFQLVNGGAAAANVTNIKAVPNCYVPSLTTYGIAALVLILIASSIFVVYRRRKAVTA